MANKSFSISGLAIRQHIGTLMLTLAVIVVGVFFAARLQVDLLPSITYPRIGVQLNAEGVGPEVAIDEITRPLEQSLASTEGVVQIFSRTQEGRVRVDLFFEPGSNVDQALNDATATFNRGRSRLPDEISDIRIFKFDPSQLPVYELALTSPSLEPVDLRVFADEELVRELTVVNGVAAVDVTGGVREEVRISVNINRMQALGVSLSDMLDALRERNQDISGGRIEGLNSESLTRTVGRFQSADEIRNLSFASGSQSSGNSQGNNVIPNRVYLRDFAEVIDGTENQRLSVRLNGETAVKVSIQKQPDANTIAVVEGVKKRLADLRESGLIPANATITETLDESQFIRNSIANVTSSGLFGSLLAAIAVLLFLGSLRQTFIIVISIPLSILAAVILMGAFGLSLNVFSLGGLALGVGIVVDNSVVMLETITQGLEQMRKKDQAITSESVIEEAERSSGEVESALVASTSTNLVAVLPFLLVGGFISLLFNELILTISFAVAASILVAVTVVPALTSRLLAIPFSSRIGELFVLREFDRRFQAATRQYGKFLAFVLHYRLFVVMAIVAFLGVSSILMVGQIPQEVLPRISTGQANLNVQFPPGTTIDTNRKVMAMVDDIIRKQPETGDVFSVIGGSVFGSNSTENPLRSSSTITLQKTCMSLPAFMPCLESNPNVSDFVQRVNSQLNRLNLVGVRLRLTPSSVRGLILNNSPVPRTDIDVILQGNDAEVLRQASDQVLAVLDEKVTGASFRPDADARQPEVQIRPDWERLQALGLTTQDVGETIQTAINGSVPTQLQRGNRLVDVRVELDKQVIQEASQLATLPLFLQNNRPIRVGDVAKVIEGLAPGEIQRINQRQVAMLIGTLEKNASLSQALAETKQAIANIELPEGVTLLPSTAQESNTQLQNSLKTLGGLAIFLVFVVMAVQYNSLIDPLVILLTVPLALAGGIWGLYITKTAIGATVIVGVVLLVGIVVNNAIIMVELANQIRQEERCDRATAILRAAPQRLRPILMTTITTVLGMFPLAVGIGEGSEFLRPLGIVVFSGLSLATVLTLFIIPCFYLLLHEFSPQFLSKRLGIGFKKVFRKGT